MVFKGQQVEQIQDALLDGYDEARLRELVGSERWPVHIIVPTAHPLESLAIELVPRSARKTVIADLMDDMAADPHSLHLHTRQLLRQGAWFTLDHRNLNN